MFKTGNNMHIGDIVNNRYKISGIIGHGALSTVYKAFDMKLCIDVAIKESDNAYYAEVMREVTVLNECRHQHIPRITDILYSDTSILIIEDYIEGKNIGEISANDALSGKQIFKIIMQILSVLEYLHNHDPPIIYADLKPGNIIISKDFKVYLVDFGAAVYRGNKEIWGTYGYASPEQVLTCSADVRTDIYSFGKTCIELYGLSNKKINRNIYNILLKCISADRDKRYKSISDVRHSLEELKKRNRRKHYFNIITIILSLLIIVFLQQLIRESSLENYVETEKMYDITGDNPGKRAEAYILSLKDNPSDIQSFRSLIYEYKSDFVFSEEEERELKSAVYPNIGKLKKSSIYGEISYEIGILYWYYYGEVFDLHNIDNIRKAMYWISQSSDERADIYKKVGGVILNSQNMIKEGSSGDILKNIEYFDSLLDFGEENGNPVIIYRCSILILSAVSRLGPEIGKSEETAGKVSDMIKRIKILNAHSENEHINLDKLNEVIKTTETVVNKYKNM